MRAFLLRIRAKVVSTDGRHARTGREIRFAAPMFIDCSGRALLGQYAHAQTLHGQVSQAEYGENLAPKQGEETHHGHTGFFRAALADSPVDFAEVPWATEIAKDCSGFGGQLVKPGIEIGPGPSISGLKPNAPRRMIAPDTHYWECGQYLDPYTDRERIRGHLLRAVYGTFFCAGCIV
jgi:hypothetical protein